MDIIIAILISYFAISLIAFIGIWKDLEKESDKFQELPREGRILCRSFAILFWPIYLMPCVVYCVVDLTYSFLRFLYELFTE